MKFPENKTKSIYTCLVLSVSRSTHQLSSPNVALGI